MLPFRRVQTQSWKDRSNGPGQRGRCCRKRLRAGFLSVLHGVAVYKIPRVCAARPLRLIPLNRGNPIDQASATLLWPEKATSGVNAFRQATDFAEAIAQAALTSLHSALPPLDLQTSMIRSSARMSGRCALGHRGCVANVRRSQPRGTPRITRHGNALQPRVGRIAALKLTSPVCAMPLLASDVPSTAIC